MFPGGVTPFLLVRLSWNPTPFTFLNENGNLVISQMVRCSLIGKEEVHRNAAVFLWHKAQSEAALFNVPVNNKPPQTKTSSMQLISKYFGHFPGFRLTLSASSLGYRVDCNSLKLQAWDARIIEEIYQPRKKKYQRSV